MQPIAACAVRRVVSCHCHCTRRPQFRQSSGYEFLMRLPVHYHQYTEVAMHLGTFSSFFDPLLTFLIVIEKLLLSTPWPIFLAVAGALAWLGSRSIKVSIGVMAAFFVIGFLDMWEPMVSTVTMISAATLLCLALGIPLGIWMSRSDRAQSWITPVLDIMQTIPSFVYLIPVVMMLGIGKVPGLIAVCIYAMPPIVRLTNLGIRLVDKEAMEAADAFGATYRQRLFMVQLPLARLSSSSHEEYLPLPSAAPSLCAKCPSPP